MVTAAGVLMIVIGVLIALIGLVVVLGGSLIGSVGNRPDIATELGNIPASLGGFIAAIGAVVVAYGALELVSGIFVLLGRGWARITAIILAVLGVLFSLPGLFGNGVRSGGVVIPLALLVAYLFVIWALSVNGRYFAAADRR